MALHCRSRSRLLLLKYNRAIAALRLKSAEIQEHIVVTARFKQIAKTTFQKKRQLVEKQQQELQRQQQELQQLQQLQRQFQQQQQQMQQQLQQVLTQHGLLQEDLLQEQRRRRDLLFSWHEIRGRLSKEINVQEKFNELQQEHAVALARLRIVLAASP